MTKDKRGKRTAKSAIVVIRQTRKSRRDDFMKKARKKEEAKHAPTQELATAIARIVAKWRGKLDGHGVGHKYDGPQALGKFSQEMGDHIARETGVDGK